MNLSKSHPYDDHHTIYNFFFHPLHSSDTAVTLASIITNIALTIFSGGLWQIPFWIINRMDAIKIEIWNENQVKQDIPNLANNITGKEISIKPKSLSIKDHAVKILPSIQNALNKEGKDQKEINAIDNQLREYRNYAAMYRLVVSEALTEADFLFVHGAMHVSHVALMIPVMVNFYRTCGDERALKITNEEVTALQIAALYHDYGRAIEKNDLVNDSHVMETKGADTCCKYLKNNGFSKDTAKKMQSAMLHKDSAKEFENKDIFAEILQNCDCLAYIRAHDSSFSPKYLDVLKRFPNLSQTPDKQELLWQIFDATKLLLMSIGDSPDDEYIPFSAKYKDEAEKFKGRICLKDKRKYELDPNCFELLQTQMQQFEELKV